MSDPHDSDECNYGSCDDCTDESCCCTCHLDDDDEDAEEIYQQDRAEQEREVDPREGQ